MLENFGQFTALLLLHLRMNQLTVLPESSGQYVALQNQLLALPGSIGQLAATDALRMEELLINRQPRTDNKRLAAWPESFDQLMASQGLELWRDRLTT